LRLLGRVEPQLGRDAVLDGAVKRSRPARRPPSSAVRPSIHPSIHPIKYHNHYLQQSPVDKTPKLKAPNSQPPFQLSPFWFGLCALPEYKFFLAPKKDFFSLFSAAQGNNQKRPEA
jgi:hypothetical protein